MRAVLLCSVAFLASGCLYSVHQVSAGGFEPSVPLEGHRVLHASASQDVVFGTKETSYVEAAWESMLRQCPNGAITAVTVERITHHLFFAWNNEVTFRGVCVEN